MILGFRQYLEEGGYHSTLRAGGWSARDAEIFKNPGRKDLMKCADNPYKEARFLVKGQDVYVWNTEQALHADVFYHLNNKNKSFTDETISGYIKPVAREVVATWSRHIEPLSEIPFFKRLHFRMRG